MMNLFENLQKMKEANEKINATNEDIKTLEKEFNNIKTDDELDKFKEKISKYKNLRCEIRESGDYRGGDLKTTVNFKRLDTQQHISSITL